MAVEEKLLTKVYKNLKIGKILWTNGTAQQVKGFATNPNDLSLIPWQSRRESTPASCSLISKHIQCMPAHTLIFIHIQCVLANTYAHTRTHWSLYMYIQCMSAYTFTSACTHWLLYMYDACLHIPTCAHVRMHAYTHTYTRMSTLSV